MTRNVNRRSLRRAAFAAACTAVLFVSTPVRPAIAQQTLSQRPGAKPQTGQKSAEQQKSEPGKAQTGKPTNPKGAGTDTTGSDPAAVNHYADAANFQNNAAYKLAVEEWQKLLKDFPKDPLASKAAHYLGVCYMQLEQPDYVKAAEAFSRALADKELEVREETLVNLGWCQFMQARAAEVGSPAQRKALEQAGDTLAESLKAYPQGGYVDQALFYMGEIQFALNHPDRAVEYYDQLVKAKTLSKSSLRPDAQYAMGVAYEQLKRDTDAQAAYDAFLQQYPQHRLVGEIKLRSAEIMLRQGKAAQAEQMFAALAATQGNALADYAMLRQAQSLAEQRKFPEAAQVFRGLSEKFPASKHASTARLSAGQMYFQNGQYPEAEAELRQLIGSRDAQAADAIHWLALTLQRKGGAAESVKLIQDALAWAGATPSALNLRMDLADALYEMPDKLNEAREAYERIANEQPDDPLAPRAAYNAAFAALQLGRLDDARRMSELFLKKYPQDPLRIDVAYVASETMLQQGQHAGAIDGYSKLIAGDPKNPAIGMWNMRLAMAYFLSGKHQEAIDLLTSKLPQFTDPKQQAEARFVMGACYLNMDKLDAAIAEFNAADAAAKVWPQADEVQLLLSQAQQRKGDAAAAEKTLAGMLQRFPQSRMRFQAVYRMGQLQVAQKKYAEAMASYESLLKEPSAKNLHDYAQYGTAYCAMQQEKWSEALTALEPLLSAGRTDALAGEARLAEGLSLRKLGRFDQAVASLEKFLASKPTDTALGNGLYELGMAHVESKRFDAAIADFDRLQKEVPEYPAGDKVLFELAWAHSEKGEHAKALELFEAMVKRFPASDLKADALYEIGQQRYKSEDFKSAAAAYTEASTLAIDPDLKEKAVYKLGWSLFQQNDLGGAFREFQSQAKQFSGGKLIVDAHFMSAECLFKQDKFVEALRIYEQARGLLETAKTDRDVSEQVRTLIYLHGAQCLREQKKWAEDEQWLREIIKRYPSSPYLSTVILELATAEEKQGQADEAIRLYGEVATKYRDDVAARARFMMGEIYFGRREFEKAVPEFQRVMYGYGADKAAEAVKNWQARAGFEAGRCSEVLIQDLKGDQRTKAIGLALEFYQYVIDKHPTHEVVKQAQVRMDELKKLR
ncbi:MAG: tetratricopeptide repeat protein [Pirellulales bacterium]